LSQAEARMQLGLAVDKRTIALLPGSRTKEIAYLLPDMLAAAGILKERFQDLQFVLPVAHTLSEGFIRTFTDASHVSVKLVDGRVYDVLRASDAAIVTSGTATLETGLMAVPMIIVYRFSTLSYLIGRMLVYVQQIGLVNIVAGKTVAPELIQRESTPEKMADAMTKILGDPEHYEQIRSQLAEIRTLLGEGGASSRVASVVLDLLKSNG
jgi:lipid-A-disaccharide synthase